LAYPLYKTALILGVCRGGEGLFWQGGEVDHFRNINRIEIDYFLGSPAVSGSQGVLIFFQGGEVEHILNLII